ncbi:hypothetical protein RQP46_002576 [Phenoliferia psychrophenolica]
MSEQVTRVIPVYLTEISPVAFRAVWPGVAYQLGNMVSAASSQIEATAGENLKTAKGLPDYGKVSCILIGVVAGFIIILTLLGREAHGTHFEKGLAAFEANAGFDVIEADKPVPSVLAADAEKGTTEEVDRATEKDGQAV